MDEIREAQLAALVTRLLFNNGWRPTLVDLTESLPFYRFQVRGLIGEMISEGWFEVHVDGDQDRGCVGQVDYRYSLTTRGQAAARALLSRLYGRSQELQGYLEEAGLSIFAGLVVHTVETGEEGDTVEEPTAVPTLLWSDYEQKRDQMYVGSADMLRSDTVARWRRVLPEWRGEHCIVIANDNGASLGPVNMTEAGE